MIRPKALSSGVMMLGWLPLLFLPVWLGAGTYRPWQTSFIPLSVWAWVCFWIAPASADFPDRRSRLRAILRDPACWGTVLFWMFLALQMWNSGRIRYFDFDLNRYAYTPPPHSRLPGAFGYEDALEMLNWFVPVLSVFLIGKHAFPLIRRRIALHGILLNALLIGALALLHRFQGWEKMYYNLRDSGPDTYGSFGYPNHAATFFILMFSFSAGLFLRTSLRGRGHMNPPRLLGYGFCMVFFFLCAQFSASRAGILGVWLVLGLAAAILSVLGWPRLRPVQCFDGICFFILLSVLLAALFRLFAQPEHFEELRQATTELHIGNEAGYRWFQIRSALDIWRDHPWFGVGGWGYPYLAGFYLDPSEWNRLGVGKANVHNDFAQFLAEFGLLGMGLLALIFLPAAFMVFKSALRKPEHAESLWADPFRFLCLLGVLLMLLHSMIDLPFRSPAVFSHGTLLLLFAASSHDRPSVWIPKFSWGGSKPSRSTE
jgi:O-antigen ligase